MQDGNSLINKKITIEGEEAGIIRQMYINKAGEIVSALAELDGNGRLVLLPFEVISGIGGQSLTVESTGYALDIHRLDSLDQLLEGELLSIGANKISRGGIDIGKPLSLEYDGDSHRLSALSYLNFSDGRRCDMICEAADLYDGEDDDPINVLSEELSRVRQEAMDECRRLERMIDALTARLDGQSAAKPAPAADTALDTLWEMQEKRLQEISKDAV